MYSLNNDVNTVIRKTKNRFIKEILQLKFINNFQERYYQNQILKYKSIFSETSACYKDIYLQLENNGIYVTHIDNLHIVKSKQFVQACLDAIPSTKAQEEVKSKHYLLIAESQKIIEHPEIFTWGLDQKLIATISKYLKLPVAYHGAYLRRDLAINIANKSRLWHLDKEDRRMIKIIIYLNNVDQSNGAFQYIPKYHTSDLIRKLRYNHEYLLDKKVENFIPRSEWITCAGKTGTVIFVDTANVFHRGLVPQTSDRLSIFFDYTSAFPLRPYYCKSCVPLQDLLLLVSGLSAKQKEYVFWNRKLKRALAELENRI